LPPPHSPSNKKAVDDDAEDKKRENDTEVKTSDEKEAKKDL